MRLLIVRHHRCFLLCTLIGTLACCCLLSCNFMAPEKPKTVLSWKDQEAGLVFDLIWSDGMVGYIVDLHVSQDDKQVISGTLTDKASGEGTVSFLKVRDWLLVLNDKYVLGGFNYRDKEICFPRKGTRLPFTVHGGSGEVVASHRLSKNSGSPPSLWVKRPDPVPAE